MSRMTVHTKNGRHILVSRYFHATPEAVYRAHTEPDMIRRWLLGPEGWLMPVCVLEAWPGGRVRYEYVHRDGRSFTITGEVLEVQPCSRFVHVSRMHLPEATPDNHVETTFEPEGDGTRMNMRMSLPDAKTCETMLASGMTGGMETSFERLEQMTDREGRDSQT